VQDTVNVVKECTKEIRTISYLLHPPTLDELGLGPALSWYAEGFAKRSGIQLDVEMQKNFKRLQPEFETTLFRIVQEALTNIHRHAGAKKARIALVREGDSVRLTITDDGRGIPPPVLSDVRLGQSGVGVAGMRERVRELGGEFDIQSDQQGTRLQVLLFLRNDERPPAQQDLGSDVHSQM
jgi:signal transduction histidine kinase